MKSKKASRQMFERARQVMPRGVTSNFRYWGDDKTLVLKRAEGAYIWGREDTRYIDYRLGFGPVVHDHPAAVVGYRSHRASLLALLAEDAVFRGNVNPLFRVFVDDLDAAFSRVECPIMNGGAGSLTQLTARAIGKFQA